MLLKDVIVFGRKQNWILSECFFFSLHFLFANDFENRVIILLNYLVLKRVI